MACESAGVHERRPRHPLPQRPAQLLEPGQIARQAGGQGHVLLGRLGRQLLQVEVAQLAPAGPPDRRPARHREGRDPHPEGIQAGGVPVVGQGVQAEIDPVVELQILGPRSLVDERDACRINLLPLQPGQDLVPRRALWRHHQEARPGTARSTRAQSARHPAVDLAEGVQAAEGDRAGFQGRQRAHRRLVGQRVVTPEGVRQAHGFLGVEGVEQPRRIEVGIGQAVVDGRQPGRPGISQPGDLHRRRLAGEDQEPVVGRVQPEVDEDVDPVAAHQVGDLRVGEPRDVAPDVGIAAQPIGQGVGAGHLGIAEDLELRRDRGSTAEGP